MDEFGKGGIIIVHGDSHDLSTKFMKHGSLFWFGVDVSPHLVCGAVFCCDVGLIDFVLNIEVFDFYVLCAFGAIGLAIGFEKDGDHVVLVEKQWVHIIALFFKETMSP